MPNRNDEKKRIEGLVLGAARQAGAPIPVGEGRGTEPAPDFWIDADDGGLGVELTEFLCPGDIDNAMPPVEEEKFHREVIRIAQQQYYAAAGALPARVRVYFANSRGVRQNKQHMARMLCEHVKANLHRAEPAVALSGPSMPPGFASMSITSERGDWWSGECVGVTVPDIRRQLAERIADKNKRVPIYRECLPRGAQVWLLLYRGVDVSRSVPIPYRIDEWRFPFDFEKVLWFTFLEKQIIEIQRLS
jgi:hypothetical protein